MSVKPSHTGARILRVLDAIAGHQPIGVRALARILEEDKSAIHRAIVTLVEEGWIQSTLTEPVQWEVSPRVLAIADKAYGGFGLKQRARPMLERLRDESGETAVLIVPDAASLVVADVVESDKMLRVVSYVGRPVTTEKTASGRALLSHFDGKRQRELLGREPDDQLLQIYAAARSKGYAISERETNPGTTSVAAPIIDFDGLPCGAVTIMAPSERMTPETLEKFGQLVVNGALSLSRGVSILI